MFIEKLEILTTTKTIEKNFSKNYYSATNNKLYSCICK